MKRKNRWWVDPVRRPIICAKISENIKKHYMENPKEKKIKEVEVKKYYFKDKKIYLEFRKNLFEKRGEKCQRCHCLKKLDEFSLLRINNHLDDILLENNINSEEEALNCPELWNEADCYILCKDCSKKNIQYTLELEQKLLDKTI